MDRPLTGTLNLWRVVILILVLIGTLLSLNFLGMFDVMPYPTVSLDTGASPLNRPGPTKNLSLECLTFNKKPIEERQYFICLDGVTRRIDRSLVAAVRNRTREPDARRKSFATATNNTLLEVVVVDFELIPSPNLLLTIYNIANVYGGGEVAFSIFYRLSNAFEESFRKIKQENWNIRFLPMNHTPNSYSEYQSFMCSTLFWNHFVSQFILTVQLDVMVIKPLEGDVWYTYDYIGAVWWEGNRENVIKNGGTGKLLVGNGGYSLRRVSTAKKILAIEEFNNGIPEDIWWSAKISVHGVLASEELAFNFSIENLGIVMGSYGVVETLGQHVATGIHNFFPDSGGEMLRLYVESNLA